MKKIAILMISVLAFIKCNTDELQKLNINPQAVNQIDLNFMFSTALLSVASQGSSGDSWYLDWRTNIGMCAYAIQHFALTSGGIGPGDKYTDNAETRSAPFEMSYQDQLKNIAEILKQTGTGGYDAGNKKNTRNAARLLRAWTFTRLVDFYGNVPYTEANNGIEGTYFPKYDDGKTIYKDLLKEIDEAAGALNSGDKDQAGFAKADFVYKGDISKWKKFGYSLMLRLAMRASDADLAQANTYVAKAIAGGVMTSNDDNFFVPTSLNPIAYRNGISRAIIEGGQASYLSNTLVDFLKGKQSGSTADDDPRLMIFTSGIGSYALTGQTVDWKVFDADPTHQKGMPNGKDISDLKIIEGKDVNEGETYSRLNYKLLQIDEPYMVMNAGETELLLAEAKLKNIGGVSGTDKEHYEKGVKLSCQMYTKYDASLSVSDAAVSSYLTTYPYGVTKPAIEMIADQLWLGQYMNWYEAWSNWRRLDLPKLTPTNHPSNITGGKIPVRLPYPLSESANPNVKTGGVSPDTYTTKVWWDTK